VAQNKNGAEEEARQAKYGLYRSYLLPDRVMAFR
jgi:hypothetical protein